MVGGFVTGFDGAIRHTRAFYLKHRHAPVFPPPHTHARGSESMRPRFMLGFMEQRLRIHERREYYVLEPQRSKTVEEVSGAAH